MFHNHLIYRLLILNTMFASFFAWATAQGYVTEIIVGDTSRITIGIIALFLVGMASVVTRVVKVSRRLNALKRDEWVDASDEAKFFAKGEHINSIGGWLVQLGLIGTVVGFIMSLSSIDPNSLTSASGVQQSVGQLLSGMQVAIYTTLAGAVFAVILEVNAMVLNTATKLMFHDAVTHSGA